MNDGIKTATNVFKSSVNPNHASILQVESSQLTKPKELSSQLSEPEEVAQSSPSSQLDLAGSTCSNVCLVEPSLQAQSNGSTADSTVSLVNIEKEIKIKEAAENYIEGLTEKDFETKVLLKDHVICLVSC